MPDLPDFLILLGWVTIGCAVYAVGPLWAAGYVGVSLCVLGVNLHKLRATRRAAKGP